MAKSKKQKVSRVKYIKEPKSEVQSPDALHPVFSFRFLRTDYGVASCNVEQLSGFVKQLNLVSQLTWGIWKMSPRTGIGPEKIARESLNVAVPTQISDDIEYFLCFRFHNGRCLGYRDGVTFYIVWIDGSFKLYNH